MLKKTFIVLLLILVSLSISPSQIIANNLYDKVNKRFTFETPEVDIKDNYAHIKMNDLPTYGAPGEPILPFKTVRLLLPPGQQVSNIHVDLKGKHSLKDKYTVMHGQKYVPIGSKWEYTSPEPAIYKSNKPFPGRIYGQVSLQKKMGYSILITLIKHISA